MKIRTTAIAMAVAGIVAAPVAVQAGADEVYASARVGLKYTDTDDVADFDARNFASRFGMRGETDLGNGITGFGRYEFGVNSAESSSNTITSRHHYVGLKGDFGSVLIGQTYHTFYNYVVGPLDLPWWHSTGNMVESVGRTPGGITYAGSAGAVSFGATAYFATDSEETAPDALEIGASTGIGDMTLGFAFRSVDEDGAVPTQGSTGDDEDVIAVALTGIGIGDTTLGASFMSQDDDTGFVIHWDIGNFMVHAELLDKDAADESPVDLTLVYTQSLGRKTTMYYEINSFDADTGDSDDDSTAVMAVLKYDII